MHDLYYFDVTVKSTGKVIRQLGGYGDTREAARKDANRIFRKQYDKTCCELGR
jgi:hypothetical protein